MVPAMAFVAVVGGLAVSLISIVVSNPYPMVIGPFTVAGALGVVLFKEHSPSLDHTISATGLFSAIYLTVCGISILLFVQGGYSRTIPVHAALIAIYTLAFVSIFVFESSLLSLSLIIFAGILHRAFGYYGSALILGNDPVFHARMASLIEASGTLEPLAAAGSKYWFMPFQHLLVATLVEVGHVSARTAMFLGISVPLVVVPAVVVFALLRSFGATEAGILAAGLYVLSDRVVGLSLVVIPTSTGVLLATMLLLASIRYLHSENDRYLVVIYALIVAQVLNHPLSMVATTVIIGVYILVSSVWDRSFDFRKAVLSASLVLATVGQLFITSDGGPQEGSQPIFGLVVDNLRTAITAGGGRSASAVPEAADFVLNGTNTLSPLAVAGTGILFGFAVFGGLGWLSRQQGEQRRDVLALCAIAGALAIITFVPPLFGISILLPNRWFGYLYIFMAMLAGVGVITFVSIAERRHVVIGITVLLALVVPYGAFMTASPFSAPDGPIFDESPTSDRTSATPQEAATYEFTAQYADGSTVVADRVAENFIERGRGYPATTYGIHYGTNRLINDEWDLLVDRSYAHSSHAKYRVKYRGRWHSVFGPLPANRSMLTKDHSVVYSAGPDRVVSLSGVTRTNRSSPVASSG